jgi:hypothetical protein
MMIKLHIYFCLNAELPVPILSSLSDVDCKVVASSGREILTSVTARDFKSVPIIRFRIKNEDEMHRWIMGFAGLTTQSLR